MSTEEEVVVEEEKQPSPAEEAAAQKAAAIAPRLPALLQNLTNGPTADQIEKWKAKHGEVYVSGFSEEELYVWRPITRPEYVKLQRAATQTEGLDQFKYEELVCETCILFSSNPVNWSGGKAGTVPVLNEQIMYASNFLPTHLASMLVEKL